MTMITQLGGSERSGGIDNFTSLHHAVVLLRAILGDNDLVSATARENVRGEKTAEAIIKGDSAKKKSGGHA